MEQQCLFAKHRFIDSIAYQGISQTYQFVRGVSLCSSVNKLMSVCLYFCVSTVFSPFFLFLSLSLVLKYLYVSVSLFLCLSICLSVCFDTALLFSSLSLCFYVCLSVCFDTSLLFSSLAICLSVFLPLS